MAAHGVTEEKILLLLLKGIRRRLTVTEMANRLGLTRAGVWKAIAAMEKKRLIRLNQIGTGKTSIREIHLNIDEDITIKKASAAAIQESERYLQWKDTFKRVFSETEFIILFGSILTDPRNAGDIDILLIPKKNGDYSRIYGELSSIQKSEEKRIHATILSEQELIDEIDEEREAILDALFKGVILSGHDNFIEFVRKLG